MNEVQNDLESELNELVKMQMEMIINKYGAFYGSRKHEAKARKRAKDLLYRRQNLLTDKDMEIDI